MTYLNCESGPETKLVNLASSGLSNNGFLCKDMSFVCVPGAHILSTMHTFETLY